MIEIKRWTDGKVLYTAETSGDVKTALEEAVREKADLGFANLRSATLGSADLRSADLGSADLGSADLGSADLRYADLGSADLGSANLRSANLRFADLRSADLRSANLRSANLRFADLRFADLRSADLRSADLGFADLGSANLGSATLGSANLRSATLGFGDLRSANLTYRHALWASWTDFCAVLDQAPAEAPGLRTALVEGRVDGSVYEGTCACLVGTIAKVRHVDIAALDISLNGSRPAEQWFLPIREGDVPVDDLAKAKDSEGVFRASVAVRWIDEWITSRSAVARMLAEAA